MSDNLPPCHLRVLRVFEVFPEESVRKTCFLRGKPAIAGETLGSGIGCARVWPDAALPRARASLTGTALMPNLVKLKIGEFILDPSRGALTGAEGEIALEPKVVDVLLALAAQPGVVLSRDELVDAVWKTEFGADERLTRAISLLRKAFGDERGTVRHIETISKRGYRLLASVGPAQDTHVVPDRAQDTEPMQAPRLSQPSHAWQRFAAAAGIVAALGGVGFATSSWLNTDPMDSAQAVDVVELSPLHVVEKNPAMDTFARQAHASLKRILASNQVALVDNAERQPQTVSGGARKDPEFVLSGLLEKIDDLYAVTLYFNDRQGGQTLWSRRFTRGVSQGEELREEIGANAAYIIRCALKQRAVAAVRPALEVFKVYLETCDPHRILDGGPELLAMAQRLTEMAPDDAYGHGLLALANANASGALELTQAQSASYKAAARRSAARARELDPRSLFAPLAEAWLAPGSEYWRLQDLYVKNWGLGHAVAVMGYMGSLRTSGRLKEAVHVLERGIAAIPLSPKLKTAQAVLTMTIGDHEGADRLFKETSRLWPDFEAVHWYRFVNAAFFGKPDQALILLNSSDTNVDEKVCWRVFIEARRKGGNTDGRAVVRKACASADWSSKDYKARMLAALGDTDGAYEMMQDKSFDWDGATVFLFYPEMKQFRRDARFMPFVAGSGLVEYWLASGNWPDFCADEDQTYDCKTAAALAMKNKATHRTEAASQN